MIKMKAIFGVISIQPTAPKEMLSVTYLCD